MSFTRVTSRYAKALIDLAKEQKVLDAVEKDMKLFVDTCIGNRELRLILKNPIISHDKKSSILESLFGKKVNKLTLAFFNIVSRKSRENILYEIAEQFETQVLLSKGVRKATLTTAIDLDKKQKERITKLLADSVGNKIEIEERIDADLIGGFIIQVDDQQIDSSIKADLVRMRNKFNDSTYINKL